MKRQELFFMVSKNSILENLNIVFNQRIGTFLETTSILKFKRNPGSQKTLNTHFI